MAAIRPSPSSVRLGYQRAEFMEDRSDHWLVAGSKTLLSVIPTSPPLWPPITISRPSGSWARPEQKICEVWLGTEVKAPVAGSQSRTEGVPPVSHASQVRILPVRSRDV